MKNLSKRSILIGADHRGFALKQSLIERLDVFCAWIDCGTYSADRIDYPVIARTVIERLKQGEADRAILLCGTGAGMQIVANRTPGIYAAVAWNADVAERIKEEDACNLLVLPADFIALDEAVDCVISWERALFKVGRYEDRVRQIDSI